MIKKLKRKTVAVASLVVVGTAVLGLTSCTFSTVKYESNTHEITEDFTDISVSTNTADIVFARADDGKAKVECYEQAKLKHTVAVQDGVLSVEVNDQRAWYDYVSIDFKSPKVTIYLPETQYGALTVKESTGDVRVAKDFTFDSMNISVSTGDVWNYASVANDMSITASTGDIRVENVATAALKMSVSTGDITVTDLTCEGDFTIKGRTGSVKVNAATCANFSVSVSTGSVYLTDVACENLTASASTGDVSLKYIIAEEKLSVSVGTGDVSFNTSDAGEIVVKTTTGDVRGTLLSDKIFLTSSSTGKVSVPKTTTGGVCDITVSTGDIIISITEHVEK